MKKLLLSLLFCGILIVTPVQAQTDATTGGTSANEKNTTAATVKEKVITIRTQAQELVQLREQLRTKIAGIKDKIKAYRNQEQLTAAQIEEIKALTESIKTVQQKLQSAYQSVVQATNKYKSDTSTKKITGLDLVITSQQERKVLLQEAIAALS